MLTVADLMTIMPRTVFSHASLLEVLNRMNEEECRQFPVIDNKDRLVGIITDRDIRLAISAMVAEPVQEESNLLLRNITVEDCMTASPITVSPDAPAARAAMMLATYKFGALPVLESGKLIGIITVTDFLNCFMEQDRSVVIDN